MKANILFILVLIAMLSVGQSQAQRNPKQSELLTRTLIFTFKPQATTDSIQMVDFACLELSKVSVIRDFEWGIENTSNEKKRHLYFFSFGRAEDIEVYLKSSQHADLVKAATPVVESFEVIDYWKN